MNRKSARQWGCQDTRGDHPLVRPVEGVPTGRWRRRCSLCREGRQRGRSEGRATTESTRRRFRSTPLDRMTKCDGSSRTRCWRGRRQRSERRTRRRSGSDTTRLRRRRGGTRRRVIGLCPRCPPRRRSAAGFVHFRRTSSRRDLHCLSPVS